jgi:hypothetical protein
MCKDALVARHSRRLWVLAILVLTCALAPSGQAAQGRKVSPAAERAGERAVERVEREMRDEGANRSRLLGCWRAGRRVVDCTGEVGGTDGYLTWRCMLQIRVRRRDTGRHRSKLTDAVCVVEEVAKSKR